MMFSANSGESKNNKLKTARDLGGGGVGERLRDVNIRLPQSRAIRGYLNRQGSSSKVLSFLHLQSIYPLFPLWSRS